jgi:hypothetical protein
MTSARLSHDGRTLTVRVPMTFTKRGGRKLVISPDGAPSWAPPRRRVDNTTVKALARAFRWRRLLETSFYGTVEEIAAAEKINASYVSRVLRLTLLAPDIVEAILDGRQPASLTLAVLTLAVLMKPFPVCGWGSGGWRTASSHSVKFNSAQQEGRGKADAAPRACGRDAAFPRLGPAGATPPSRA